MIIRTQNKDRLVNLDKVDEVHLFKYRTGRFKNNIAEWLHAVVAENSANNYKLGEYSSERNAKAALEIIMFAFRDGQFMASMPTDGEAGEWEFSDE